MVTRSDPALPAGKRRRPAATTVKVTTDVRDRINRLKDAQQTSVDDVLSSALDTLEEHEFWRRQAAAHAALHADPELHERVAAETALWDETLIDGQS